MKTLVLYTKRNCPLCDEAKELLLEMQREGESNFSFAEIDIMNDGALYEKYKHEVPVLCLNGDALCNGHITRDILFKKLAQEV